jgi:hypothetical protein
VSIFVYANYVYPVTSQSLGGGVPKIVQLVVGEENAKLLEVLNIEVSNGMTGDLILIDQTNDRLLMQITNGGRVFELSTRLILGIAH